VALTETWSHTARGGHWANYEWLTQVLFYGLWAVGGMPLLTLAAAASIIAAYVITWRAMRGPLEARALLLVVAATDSTLVWAVRPQVLTLCLLAVTLSLILDRRWTWLPPIFVLWANLHGGVALGGLLLIAALVAAVLLERRTTGTILLTGTACAVAGWLTPLGWRYWTELVISIGRSAANRVMEWQSPAFEGPHLVFWAALVGLPIVAVRHRSRLARFDTMAPVVAALCCGILAARAQRNVPVFLLVAMPAFSRLLWNGQLPPTSTRSEPWRSTLHLGVLIAGAGAAASFVIFVWLARPDRLGWRPMSPDAASAIGACEPPIYNPYNEGGYLVWFVPGQPVFLDSRQDPYPVALVQAHIRAEQQQDYLPLFKRYGIRCAVFSSLSEGPSRLSALGWRERFRDRQWVVLDPPR